MGVQDVLGVPASVFRRTNLWPRLVLAVSLGFLALFVILDLLTRRAAAASRTEILGERLVIAQMAAAQEDAWLSHAFTQLQGAGGGGALAAVTGPDLAAALAHALAGLGSQWLGLYLIDANGDVRGAAPPARGVAPGVPSPDSAALQSLRMGHRVVGTPSVDPLTAKPAVLLTVPVQVQGIESEALAGVLDLSQPDLLQPLTEAKGLGQTGHAELFDSRGLVIASTDGMQFLLPGEHRESYLQVLHQGGSSVTTAPVDPRTTAEAVHEQGNHIMAVADLSNAQWGVAVGGSEAETLAPVNDLRNEMLMAGAIILAALWGLTLIGARVLVRPVRTLTRAADRISSGDLETTIRVREGGEIGKLGETLEHMRQRLRVSLDEVVARDRELERRVEERTREVQTLYEELQRKEELRGRLLEKVISVQEEERKRIARELHDETGQALTGIILSLEAAQTSVDDEPERARERLENARSLAFQSIDAIRHLVVDLRPAALDDLGLVPALRAFAESHLGERRIALTMDVSGHKRRLPPPIETCLFRVVQEAVTNIVRHSGARSASIELRQQDGVVSLVVADDGSGFDLAGVKDSADPMRALGLAGMEERVALVGGHLNVASDSGKGTRVTATIPVGSWNEAWK